MQCNTIEYRPSPSRQVRAKPRYTVRIDVDTWARLYGMDGSPSSPIQLGPLFDFEHARTADLRRPLILVTLVVSEGDHVQLIADGSHRLYRAYAEGRDSLPAWMLTAAETEAITLAGPNQKLAREVQTGSDIRSRRRPTGAP